MYKYLFLFSVFFSCTKKDMKTIKKININYSITSKEININLKNISKHNVFMSLNNFLIYRNNYKDTLSIYHFYNGKSKKTYNTTNINKNGVIIQLMPVTDYDLILSEPKINGLDSLKQNNIYKILSKLDPTRYNDEIDYKLFKKYPICYEISKGKFINLNILINIPIEKGKYKIFFNKDAYDELRERIKIPDDLKILNASEIQDNPLEFEIK